MHLETETRSCSALVGAITQVRVGRGGGVRLEAGSAISGWLPTQF